MFLNAQWDSPAILPEVVVLPATTDTVVAGWEGIGPTEPCVVPAPATAEMVPVPAVVWVAGAEGVAVGAWGTGWLAGTSVALLSGRAMEIRESRRSSFSVSRELRRITGWDSMFISWPRGDASRLNKAPSVSPAPPRGTVFMDALPLRLTFMLSSLTRRSQKSVEMPRDCGVTEQALRELWVEVELLGIAEELLWLVAPDRQLALAVGVEPAQRRVSNSDEEADRGSLQRCWVKWLGNTYKKHKRDKKTYIKQFEHFIMYYAITIDVYEL